ncbi:MAG: thermonuclease family protein [Candidatus Omnitrophica bacterium]|nr:thermonuclease family protein [Candidatus Omnitrophota bacterium]
MPNVPAVDRFRKLVDDISRLYLDARRVQLQFAWQTGRLIVVEEQNGEMRAAYGKELIPKLSKALTKKYGPGFSDTNLRKMRHFYLLHPKQATSPELDWSDYIELLPVRDEKTRKKLERRILQEDLKSSEIRRLVRAKLRLRGIDTPEVGTPPRREPLAEGDRAKKFVEKLLPAGSTIVLKSHKDRTDQHGRFVVDVFYKQGCDDAGTIIKDGTYLNQELLDKGYATRY